MNTKQTKNLFINLQLFSARKIQMFKQKALSYISMNQKRITKTRYVIPHWWKNGIDFMNLGPSLMNISLYYTSI